MSRNALDFAGDYRMALITTKTTYIQHENIP